MAIEDGQIVGVALNKITFKEESKNIPSFAEAIADLDRTIFMHHLLEFMDKLYSVSSFGFNHYTA